MLLVWLEADTILRQKSGGKRSLDDFCSRFFGGETGAPTVKTYTRADVVSALDAVATYDWAAFFSARIDAVSARAPLGGIEDSGWRVVYGDTPNGYLAARAKVAGAADFGFSLGIWTKPDGTVADVVHGSPAFTAGLAPAMRIPASGARPGEAGPPGRDPGPAERSRPVRRRSSSGRSALGRALEVATIATEGQ